MIIPLLKMAAKYLYRLKLLVTKTVGSKAKEFNHINMPSLKPSLRITIKIKWGDMKCSEKNILLLTFEHVNLGAREMSQQMREY